jgi:hypothetical protein
MRGAGLPPLEEQTGAMAAMIFEAREATLQGSQKEVVSSHDQRDAVRFTDRARGQRDQCKKFIGRPPRAAIRAEELRFDCRERLRFGGAQFPEIEES